jgi:hypothetical protein
MKERKRIAAKGSRPYIEGVNEGNPNKQTNMYSIFFLTDRREKNKRKKNDRPAVIRQ